MKGINGDNAKCVCNEDKVKHMQTGLVFGIFYKDETIYFRREHIYFIKVRTVALFGKVIEIEIRDKVIQVPHTEEILQDLLDWYNLNL